MLVAKGLRHLGDEIHHCQYLFIIVEFLTHLGPKAISWLLVFMNRCFADCRLQSIWNKAKIVMVLKPGKPADDPKSYRPISLLCYPFKIMERLVLGRINDTIEAQLPAEPTSFRKDRCTEDQVLKLTQDIEASFDDGDKVGTVLVDLMAAYDTVWHTGLKFKLLRLLPNKIMVLFITRDRRNRLPTCWSRRHDAAAFKILRT